MHHFEVGRWLREGVSNRAGANKQVLLHHIACNLVKQRAEPWNLGEAASLSHTPLLPPYASLLTKLPRSHPSSQPVLSSRPGQALARLLLLMRACCPSPSKVPSRSLRTLPPPLQPRAPLRPRLAGRPPTPTPRLQHAQALLAPALLSSRIALVLAACAGSTVAPSSPHQPTATTPRAAPFLSAVRPLSFPPFPLPPLSHPSSTKSNALRPPDTPILSNWNILYPTFDHVVAEAQGRRRRGAGLPAFGIGRRGRVSHCFHQYSSCTLCASISASAQGTPLRSSCRRDMRLCGAKLEAMRRRATFWGPVNLVMHGSLAGNRAMTCITGSLPLGVVARHIDRRNSVNGNHNVARVSIPSSFVVRRSASWACCVPQACVVCRIALRVLELRR